MKKGFTLLELLVVVVLIAIILTIVVPSTIKILDSSIERTMEIQEKEVEDSAKVFLEDYCKTPIDKNKTCPLTRTMSNDIIYYNGEISLDTLVNNDYIDKVTIRSKNCVGRIVFTNNEPKAYLKCEDVYTTDGY